MAAGMLTEALHAAADPSIESVVRAVESRSLSRGAIGSLSFFRGFYDPDVVLLRKDEPTPAHWSDVKSDPFDLGRGAEYAILRLSQEIDRETQICILLQAALFDGDLAQRHVALTQILRDRVGPPYWHHSCKIDLVPCTHRRRYGATAVECLDLSLLAFERLSQLDILVADELGRLPVRPALRPSP